MAARRPSSVSRRASPPARSRWADPVLLLVAGWMGEAPRRSSRAGAGAGKRQREGKSRARRRFCCKNSCFLSARTLSSLGYTLGHTRRSRRRAVGCSTHGNTRAPSASSPAPPPGVLYTTNSPLLFYILPPPLGSSPVALCRRLFLVVAILKSSSSIATSKP